MMRTCAHWRIQHTQSENQGATKRDRPTRTIKHLGEAAPEVPSAKEFAASPKGSAAEPAPQCRSILWRPGRSGGGCGAAKSNFGGDSALDRLNDVQLDGEWNSVEVECWGMTSCVWGLVMVELTGFGRSRRHLRQQRLGGPGRSGGVGRDLRDYEILGRAAEGI